MEKEREHQFDTIKGLMMLCVIFTHAISNLHPGWDAEAGILKYLYYVVYTFHMPVFIFISGYFSKRKGDFGEYITNAIKNCLIPYLILNVLYGFFPAKSPIWDIFEPKWTLWYLLSLFSWKLLCEPVARLRFPIIVTIFFAIYSGCIKSVGTCLSISRTISFLPFFMLGYLADEERIEKLRNVWKPAIFAGMALIFALAYYLKTSGYSNENLFMSYSYEYFEQPYLEGAVIRGLLLVSGFLGILFFFGVVPRGKNLLSNFGRYSITIYVGHAVTIRTLRLLRVVNIHSPYYFLLFDIAFSFACCFLFGNKKVAKAYKYVFDKIGAFICE